MAVLVLVEGLLSTEIPRVVTLGLLLRLEAPSSGPWPGTIGS
jgi:hypothetical protein